MSYGWDTRDPEWVANLGIALGYEHANVIDALVSRCGVNDSLARLLVARAEQWAARKTANQEQTLGRDNQGRE